MTTTADNVKTNETNCLKVNAITGVLQLIVLILGVAAIFMMIGSKDAQLKESISDIDKLQAITADLVKAQVYSGAKDGEYDRLLQDILRRIYRLEEAR
tara:strand:+ start:585 stop:878 length:294 start_codon:yes stop_codon:yes gene_type:complete